MHRSSILLLSGILLSIAIAGCSRKDGPINNFHPYAIRHAALHLEYFGETRGTDDLFFDNFGSRETHITHSELITEKGFRPTIKLSVRNIANVFEVDSVKLDAVKLIDRTSDSLYHLPSGDVPDPESQFANYCSNIGYKLRGDSVISVQGATFKTHLWQLGEQPSFMFEYKGLVVGTYSNVNGHINELRLVSIDTVAAIDTMRFIPPNGFPVKDRTKQRPNMPDDQQ